MSEDSHIIKIDEDGNIVINTNYPDKVCGICKELGLNNKCDNIGISCQKNWCG